VTQGPNGPPRPGGRPWPVAAGWGGGHTAGMTPDAPLPARTTSPPRRRRLLVWLAVAAAVVLSLALTAVVMAGPVLVWLGVAVKTPEPTLERKVHLLFARADADDVVLLVDAAPFAWDRVGVFGPYVPTDTVRDSMGVRVPRGATNALSAFESYCLLVFAAGDRRTGWTLLDRNVADCLESSGAVVPRDEARFRGDSLTPVPAAGRA
jgi:hypothetical protein